MATLVCLKRLRADFRDFERDPPKGIRAKPLEENILEWHFVLEGPTESDYSGGWYHGILQFPFDFPLKPPSIQMYTPNGRFSTNTKICLSMTDFHPESWNPMWNTTTILVGFQSFMQEEALTYGSITSSSALKRQYASESLEFNCKNSTFRTLFPELLKLSRDLKLTALTQDRAAGDNSLTQREDKIGTKAGGNRRRGGIVQYLFAVVALLGVIMASLWLTILVTA